MERDADVVIVGGGIAGCASAYFLAKRGVRVVLVEKAEIAAEQSGRNWGVVRQQGRHPWELPLAMAANRIWRQLQRELGRDFEWLQGGLLTLAPDAQRMAELEAWQRRTADQGLESRLLTGPQAAALLPALSGSWAGGLHTAGDGQANPEKATRALAEAARDAGARLYTRCAAEAISVHAGAVSAVRTEGGEIRTPTVLCAAGAWSARLARPLGLKLPQRSFRSTSLATAPAPPLTALVVRTTELTFRQGQDGRIVLARRGRRDHDLTLDTFRTLRDFRAQRWLGRDRLRWRVGRPLLRDLRTLIPGSFAQRHPFRSLRDHEPALNRASAREGLAQFHRLFPTLADLPAERLWAGVIEATPDHLPVLGEAAAPRGFLFATGFSGHGFALGPIVGRLISELVVDGAPSLDLHRFRLGRFAEGDLAPPGEIL